MSFWDTLKSTSGYNMLDSFMNPDKAYREAEKASRRRYEEAKGFEMPFMNAGKDQLGRLTGAEDRLLNPIDLQNEWAKSYEESPYAHLLKEENMGEGLDAASAMGLMGSSGALENIQRGAGRISSGDRQNFLNGLMQKYLAGIGLGESIYGTGASAANTLAGNAMGQGGTEAGLRYGQAAAPGQLFAKILGAALSAGAGGMGGAGQGLNNSTNMFNPGG